MTNHVFNFIVGKLRNVTKESNKFHFRIIFFVFFFNILFFKAFSQGPVIVFSENFDNATSTQPWAPDFAQGWFSDKNELETISGKGKVLRVNFATGTVGSGSGLGNYRIPLDSSYKELYLSWEYFVQPDFAGGGGKFFAGFAGGSVPNIPKKFDDNTDGWASMFLFQKDGVSYSTYNYFKGTEYEPGTGWPYGAIMTNIVKGQWKRITMRLKVNDGDQSNGILEVYDNDVLVFQQSDAKVVNSIHPEYLIEGIYLNNFFGGTGSQYKSPKDQYMRFDNLVAFYYPKGSAGYRAGPSEKGRTLTIPAATSYHPEPPNKFTPYNYTMSSGTIKSHCAYYLPVRHTDGFQTSTIQVAGATTLTLNVSKFLYDGGITYIGYKQILKIYSGTGNGKVLQKTFMNGTYTTAPTTIYITGNSATIEWQAGSGCQSGFELNYSSNGTGSGTNCECGNFFAKQTSSTTTGAYNITTTTVASITQTTAVSGGNILSGGIESITVRGVCWDTLSNPDISKSKTVDGSGEGLFTSSITGIKSNKTYHVRAYYTTSTGKTAYGNDVQFTSTPATTPLAVSTTAVSAITQSTASSGGNVTSNGGANITARGVCWSTTLNPTTANNKTTDGTATGSFTSSITGLTVGTTYHVRAYVTNSAGLTAYGSDIQFTTSISTATGALKLGRTIKGNELYSAKNRRMGNLVTTGSTGGNALAINIYLLNSNNDNTAKVKAAIYNSTRTIKLGESDEISIGALYDGWVSCPFTIKPVLASTTDYWIVCWVNNPSGAVTEYENATTGKTLLSDINTYSLWPKNISGDDTWSNYEMSINLDYTTAALLPTVTTTPATSVTKITANSGGDVIADGGSKITERGICWGTAVNPTISDSKSNNGTGIGTFISSISGLVANTTYHVRAFATNSVGTAYGNDVQFTTISATSTLRLGTTVKGDDPYSAKNRRMGNLVATGSVGGVAQSISIYLLNTNNNSTAKVKAAIYNSTRTTKLGESDETTIGALYNGWVACPFTTKPVLTAATTYWIVCWVNSPLGEVTEYERATTGKTLLSDINLYGLWPANISGDDTWAGWEMSMYMDYTENIEAKSDDGDNSEMQSEIEVEYKIYPNPFSEELKIENTEQVTQVDFYNILGIKVLSVENNKNELISINTTNLKSGQYFVRLLGVNGKITSFQTIKR
jgi:hypothetical protein